MMEAAEMLRVISAYAAEKKAMYHDTAARVYRLQGLGI